MSTSKAEIIVKSKELFERFGYQKTTLTDIAKSLGKVKTAIYYYFSGKEEIFADLVKAEAEEFHARLFNEVNSKSTSIEKLESYVATRIQLMQKISKRYGFLKSEFFELIPLIEENRMDSDKKELKMITEILKQGVLNNEFLIESPEFGAMMLVGSLKGLEIQMYVTDQILIETIDIKDFTNYILYGVIKSRLN